MQKETPPLIEGEFRVVSEPPKREPIIKSWVNLWWFVGPTTVLGVLQYARIRGWL